MLFRSMFAAALLWVAVVGCGEVEKTSPPSVPEGIMTCTKEGQCTCPSGFELMIVEDLKGDQTPKCLAIENEPATPDEGVLEDATPPPDGGDCLLLEGPCTQQGQVTCNWHNDPDTCTSQCTVRNRVVYRARTQEGAEAYAISCGMGQ